ncbi:PREDICTED: uncharacterized protein LOC106105256 [Papilio polytes]|uniref:uncharacterized protein LOC106105256 n=1 Tax=Papilio polytes TaxID=76194 RepID=UPI0006762F93|nr:PREDICTED: uncharacterized protein LOC106105256 [Papilio polytes]
MSQHGYPERLSNRSKGFQEDGPSQPTMEVLVETLTGTAFEMTVSPSDTIFAIKSKIFRVEGIPVSQQHLVYNLRELADGASLRDHGVAAGARLRLVLALRGGPVTTRRPPPPEIPPPDRDDLEWSSEGGSGGGGECKVAVLVFRDGERVNMVRMRENRDGTFSPLDHAKYSSSLSHLVEHEDDECAGGGGGGGAGAGALPENAVTMGKMLDLRRRMESLSLHRRRAPHRPGDQVDIQKTRSEETLSVPSLLEDGYECYKRYDCDCACAYDRAYDRYTLLPPIRARAHSNHSLADTLTDTLADTLADTLDTDRFKLPETLAGSILVKGRESEEGVVRECAAPTPALAPLPASKYGALVGGAGCGGGGGAGAVGGAGAWRRGYGSSSQLTCGAHRPPAPLSASTSDLETLTRNRILPALSRHRNREHLHLSDERLELTPQCPQPQPQPQPQPHKLRRLRCGVCRRRLGAATEHRCRCGGAYCAPHRYAEVHGCNYDYKALTPHRN